MKRLLAALSVALLAAVPAMADDPVLVGAWIVTYDGGDYTLVGAGGTIDELSDLSSTLCGTGEILEDQGGSWACITTPAGSGSNTVLDLADDGADESTAITEIATTGDTNSIFTEPSDDKLLVDLGQNWPTCDTANAGDSATSFFSTGEVEDARVVDALTIAGGTIGTSAITLVQGASPTPTGEGVVEWDTDDDRIVVGDSSGQAIFHAGAHTTDTGPSPDCSGTSTYQDGEGNCDTVGGDISGGLDAVVVADDSHDHGDSTVADTITASNYLPLAGGTLTGEVVVDDLGLEFTEGDSLTDCSTFSSTGGGIFYDDSEGKFKKCEDNTLSDLDTGGGGAVGGSDTEILFNNSSTEDGLSWLTVDDTNQLLTQSSTLDQATGDEVAFTLGYTVNKATSGNDTGLVINQTDTASPGTSLFADFQVGGASKLQFHTLGGIDFQGSGATTEAHAQSLNLNWSAASTQTSSGIYSAVIGRDNRATADSAISLGRGNVATGASGVAIGNQNTNNGTFSVALGDNNTIDSGSNSVAVFGAGNQTAVDGDISMVAGHNGYSNNRSQFVLGGTQFAAIGDNQSATITLKAATTDATETTMKSNTTNYVIRADFAWAFSALVAARSDEADGNDSAAYRIEGLIARDESNNTAIVGSVTVTTIAESAGAASWDVTAEADDTNEALAIKVTGDASTNIRWVAKVDVAQVGHP